MNDPSSLKHRGGLPELLSSPLANITTNNSFKKIKSNSINVIDFESTLSSKNNPIFTQNANQLLFKRREFINKKPDHNSTVTHQKEMSNSLYKYLETNPNNNFNSTHYSNQETNSIKTKETNGASTNHETNRHSFSVIFNIKNSSPHHIKDQSKPYNIEPGPIVAPKKTTSNCIGNLTIDHMVNSNQNFTHNLDQNFTHNMDKNLTQNGIRSTLQNHKFGNKNDNKFGNKTDNKFGNKTDNLIKVTNEKKNADDKNKKSQIVTASLYADIKQVYDFK